MANFIVFPIYIYLDGQKCKIRFDFEIFVIKVGFNVHLTNVANFFGCFKATEGAKLSQLVY